MAPTNLVEKAAAHLRKLCLEIPGRRVGSRGNQAATDFFASVVSSFGFATESPAFDCIDWAAEGATLTVAGRPFAALVSPYSLGGTASATLVVASTVHELEMVDATGQVLLLRGELAKEQLMPKSFVFYNPDEHKHLIRLLETKKPQAIIAATSRNPEMAGAVYPFPLIEDGDFDIPSVYVTEEEGQRLAGHAGQMVALDIRARRSPSSGCNVIAFKGGQVRRVVLFAHIDAKDGTPGAIDDATGIVALLLLAELLAEYAGELGVEIVAMNGEDYYGAPGEMQYLRRNEGRFDEIVLGINLDGAGYYQGQTAYSLYDCAPVMGDLIRRALSTHPEMVEGEPWYQGDHGLFLMNKVPALALTSERFVELWTEIAHTPQDHPGIVDPAKLVSIAIGLKALILHLDTHLSRGAIP
jgi:aminopeptidase YwaD